MNWAIRTESLSKQYRIGRSTVTAAELINGQLRRLARSLLPIKRPVAPTVETTETNKNESRFVVDPSQLCDYPPDHFWALRNIDLEIAQGDRVGLIGPNGCGKSTMLKILSRIVSPTDGLFRFRGRLVSLLEIGTGFHGDLTGRENIYLNGTIMGMRTREINRRLEEIIEFSELGGMIDTPVKRYSSGMYVRLAFSVAAHLESEILIVDEVLAVGDAAFQRKCSEKMLEVAHEGRTLLFVSHDMEAVNRICNRAVHMAHGRIVDDSKLSNAANSSHAVQHSVSTITRSYLRSGIRLIPEVSWDAADAPLFGDSIQLNSVRLLTSDGTVSSEFDVTSDIHVEIDFSILREEWPINVHVHLKDTAGHYLFVSMDNLVNADRAPRKLGRYVETCVIKAPLLNVGDYRIDVELWPGQAFEDRFVKPSVVSFSVLDGNKVEGVRGNWPNEWPNTLTRPQLEWRVAANSESSAGVQTSKVYD